MRVLRLIRRHPRQSIAVIALTAGLAWIRCGALPPGLLDVEPLPSTVVLDRHGVPLYEARSALGLRSESIDETALPATLVHATLAAEDIRFRRHVGIDPIAVARAIVRDLRARQIVEGGSTITQQVAKLLIARQAGGAVAHGWRAKLREAVVALRLEHRRSKDQILALYLNLAPYGNQVQGASRAARAYFGRGVATLTAAEAAYLAALPQQPGRFNPWRAADRALPRQRRILAVMVTRGWLPAADAAIARAEKIRLQHDAAPLVAPHFVERVLEGVGRDRPRQIRTTLDAGLQGTIEGIIAAERGSLINHHAANVAVVVLDNRTSEWLAWEGSGNYLDAAHGGAIDGAVAPRQPGSALKPFTYAAAFERGAHPGRVLPDVPSQFPTAEPGVLYSPRNYDGRFRGPLLARAALAGSENVPAVVLASEVGVPAIGRLLRRAGLSTLDENAAHYGLGLTLGNAEVRLDELVAAYAMLARGGEYVAPRKVLAIDGAAQPPGTPERILSARSAFWITDILSDDGARAYVFGHGGSLEFPFPVAAKTGTSQSYFDNWVVGYTPDVTVGVWVGNFDRTPLRGSSGVTGAGPIFHAAMMAAVEHVQGILPIGDTRQVLAPPADVHRVELCAVSGMAAGEACPTRVSEWLPADAPADRCTWHHASDGTVITVWPEVYRDWAKEMGLMAPAVRLSAAAPVVDVTTTSPPTRATTTSRASGAPGLTIVRPLGGALFLIDRTLRPEFQAVALRARSGDATRLEWFVDGALVGSIDSDGALRWPLVPGRHAIVVRDDRGRTANTYIEVR